MEEMNNLDVRMLDAVLSVWPEEFRSFGNAPSLMNGLKRYMDRFSRARVLCVGDMMLDVFVYGGVDRVSPEAPVPVLRKSREKWMLGGSGNVAANLCALGCSTCFAGVVGDDEDGRALRAFLKDTGASDELLLAVPGHATAVKTRFVAGKHHLLRVDKETPLVLDEEHVTIFLGKIESRLAEADIVLLSDYGKGLFDERTTPRMIALCRDQKKKVVVDPKRMDWSIYRGASLVKPNLKEFESVAGRKFDPVAPGFVDEALGCAREICARFDIDNLLVTLSEHGMIYLPSAIGEEPVWLPTEARDVFDVSGAGDTSLAVLGASLAVGAGMPEAMRLANAASGIVVGKFGTASVTLGELEKKLNTSSDSNIVTMDAAAALAADLKARGKVVGFTNGCFDLLHLGHLQSFRKARELCDVLFVGLNSDASVKRLKGEGRPVNDERTRAEMLSALKWVDYVVVFDDDTALPLIERLRPDVIAKEGYCLDRWPEGRRVEALGGRAVELPRVEGYSTTETIRKMLS